MMLICEWLADDGIVPGTEFRKDRLAVLPGQKTDAVRALHLHPGQCGRQAIVGNRVRAQPIDRRYTWDARKLVPEVGAKGWVTVGGRRPSGTQVEIGLEFVVHPDANRVAKTADHNADTDGHGYGSGEG